MAQTYNFRHIGGIAYCSSQQPTPVNTAVDPIVDKCWTSVADGGPTIIHHCFHVVCSVWGYWFAIHIAVHVSMATLDGDHRRHTAGTSTISEKIGWSYCEQQTPTQFWYDAGPLSATLAQHWTNIDCTSRVHYSYNHTPYTNLYGMATVVGDHRRCTRSIAISDNMLI